VSIRVRGGEIARVDPAETAFVDRDSPYMISIDSTWTDPAEDEANVEWTREFWAAMEPFAADGVHLNFAMLEEGEGTVRTTFGENYERLVEVKNRYDPENLFRVNQNVQPTA
jgi:FAD/FMN-containing dehydrogenase